MLQGTFSEYCYSSRIDVRMKTPSGDTDVGAYCCVRDSQDSAVGTAADRLSSFYCLLLIVRCTARTAAAAAVCAETLIRRDIRQHLTTTFFAQLLSKSICLSIFVDMA